ncbi:hypothetical protein [Xanthomonas sp. PPL133]
MPTRHRAAVRVRAHRQVSTLPMPFAHVYILRPICTGIAVD